LNKFIVSLPAFGLVAACAMPPQGVPADAVGSYDAAVASVGCVMRSDKDYLPVELQTGMTREQVLEMTAYKIANDQAVKLEDGSVKLTTGACANAATPA
jgi:hypothetical protein